MISVKNFLFFITGYRSLPFQSDSKFIRTGSFLQQYPKYIHNAASTRYVPLTIKGKNPKQNIRKVNKVPVIMLTALSDEGTQLTTFNELADDYISKPFSLVILQKRIESLLRRNRDKEVSIWESGDASVDFEAYRGYYKGKDANLTTKEIMLFKLLVENKGRALTRDYILSSLWTDNMAPFDRIVDAYVKNLRKKLHLECLTTVKGVGYRYDED